MNANNVAEQTLREVVTALGKVSANLPDSYFVAEIAKSIKGRRVGTEQCLISSIDNISLQAEDIKTELQEISNQFKIMNESLRIVAQQMRYK